MRTDTARQIVEFTAAQIRLHYGPGPHADGTPQSVHGGGAGPAPAPTRRPQPLKRGQIVHARGKDWEVLEVDSDPTVQFWAVNLKNRDEDAMIHPDEIVAAKQKPARGGGIKPATLPKRMPRQRRA
jgi:hypothetical protein